MSVSTYRSLWGPMGFDGDISTFPDICAETAKRGFVGVETNPIFFGEQTAEVRTILDDHGLSLLARAHTFGRGPSDHLGWVQRCVDASQAFDMPHMIVQSGADYFSDDAIDEYFTGTAKIEAASGVRIAHESHRSCILYSPWVAARVLDRFPDIWLASDYSHYVIVAERFLNFEAELLARFAARTIHIDARVGTPEMPQVPDPRSDDAAEALAAFDGWWDEIHASCVARGEQLTVVPEFGPPPYEPTGAGDRDDICQWMADRLRTRWSE